MIFTLSYRNTVYCLIDGNQRKQVVDQDNVISNAFRDPTTFFNWYPCKQNRLASMVLLVRFKNLPQYKTLMPWHTPSA
jgi:hypothetical protein